MACFWAPDHRPAVTLSVEFDWKSGVAAKDWSKVAKKGQIDVSIFIFLFSMKFWYQLGEFFRLWTHNIMQKISLPTHIIYLKLFQNIQHSILNKNTRHGCLNPCFASIIDRWLFQAVNFCFTRYRVPRFYFRMLKLHCLCVLSLGHGSWAQEIVWNCDIHTRWDVLSPWKVRYENSFTRLLVS